MRDEIPLHLPPKNKRECENVVFIIDSVLRDHLFPGIYKKDCEWHSNFSFHWMWAGEDISFEKYMRNQYHYYNTLIQTLPD